MLLKDLVGLRKRLLLGEISRLPHLPVHICILNHIHIYFPSSRWILDFKQLYTVAKKQESIIIFCQVAKHISSCWQKQLLVRLSLGTGIEVVGRGDMTFLENEFSQLLPKVEIHCKVELFIFYISEPSLTG